MVFWREGRNGDVDLADGLRIVAGEDGDAAVVSFDEIW